MVARKEIPMTECFEKDTLLNSLKQFENECLSKYLIERMEYVQRAMRKKHSLFGGGGGAVQNDGGARFQDSVSVKNFGNDKGFLLYGSDDKDDD